MKKIRLKAILSSILVSTYFIPGFILAENLSHLVGKTVSIQFKKSIWSDCLSKPAYDGLKLISFADGKLGFIDLDGAFTFDNSSSIKNPSSSRCSSRALTVTTGSGREVYEILIDNVAMIFNSERSLWGDGKA